MNLLWLRKGATTFSEPSDPEYTAANRLENYHHKIQGDLAELHSSLPQQLRASDYWKSQWFANLASNKYTFKCSPLIIKSQFCATMGDQRSDTVHRVRKVCGTSIFQCLDQAITNREKRDETFRERNGWVEELEENEGGDDEGGSGELEEETGGGEKEGRKTAGYKVWDVELLHSKYNGKFDKDHIFRNPILFRVC